jgi:aryl-alcohol dehydrogenase-like predicted oxidoreductase
VDPEGTLLRTIPGVPPAALPSTVVLDRSGRIAARVIGPTTPEQLQELVDAAGR